MKRQCTLSFASDEPPKEFRIFTAGAVETVKGTFCFDEVSAASVLSEYLEHGIDLMIDYDHAALSVGVDPALSGKAAGWFNIEVRNGELWAVNVRWTPPAAEALRRKEWRFISPAFNVDEEGRITSLLNVAITNLPATRRLEPLVAASISGGKKRMEPKLVQQALDALIEGDAEKCAELLKGAIAAAASNPEAEAPEAPTEEMAAPPVVEEQKPEEAALPAAEGDKPEDEEEKKAAVVATSRLIALTGASSIVDALSAVATYRASHIELETERQKLAKERATLEAAERRQIYVDLVKLGGLAPAAVWADDKAQAPKVYLAAMPLENLRDFLASTKASKGKAAPKAPAVVEAEGKPFLTPHGSVTLSARELKFCADEKADPQVYANNKAFQIQARDGR